MRKLVLTIILISIPVQVLAVPEAPRFRKSSCTSCHVSTGGSGILTDFGRNFAAERLATWAQPEEEYLLHGSVKPNPYIMAGGDARWVYSSYQIGQVRKENFWRMQTDLELALNIQNLWIHGALGTKPAGPQSDQRDHVKIKTRAYSVRYDFFDQHLLARLGLFIPKFGLMTADHTTYTRIASDQGPENEQTQFEITLQDDENEITFAALSNSRAQDSDRQPKQGFNMSVAKMLGTRNRINLGLIKTKFSTTKFIRQTSSFVLSTVLTFNEKLFLLLEATRTTDKSITDSRQLELDSSAIFTSLNYELFRGFTPFLRFELWNYDFARDAYQKIRYGFGANWHPRPHFQTEIKILRETSSLDRSYQKLSTELILHYYF